MKSRSAKLVSLLLVFILFLSTMSTAVTVSQPTNSLPEIKNVIIMIPDGMSEDAVTLARWYEGGNPLALDEITSGLVRTFWAAGPITDSAPAGTAFSTGYKSTSGYVAVNAATATMPGVPAVSAADAKKPLETVLEAAKTVGKSTGIVVTCNIQHATPATFTSHYTDRNNFQTIGEQQVYEGLDVVLGGGYQYLSNRPDKEDLLQVIKNEGYQYVTGRESMLSIKSGKIWGMFAPDAMAYDMDRSTNAVLEPSLADMTSKAIELLSQNSKGFVLMVEGSKVDWAAHANDPIGVVSDVLAFDNAVKAALNFAKKDQHTMILAMSDHGNSGISIGASTLNSGYDKATLSQFIDPLKKATLTGEGLEKKLNADRSNIVDVMAKYYGITDLTTQEIQAIHDAKAGSMNYTVGPMIAKRANIGFTTTGHTGEDVVLYSYLPGDERVTGIIDNTDVAKLTAQALGVNLDALTAQNYVDLAKVFTARGFSFVLDKANPDQIKFFGDRGLQSVVLDQNKNYATVNGQKVTFDSLIIYNGEKFFVPQKLIDMLAPTGDTAIKPLIESVGGSVTWIPDEQAIEFTIGGSNGKLYIGSDVMELNGGLITIAKAPDFVNGRFAVSEAVADFIMSLK